MDLLTKIILSCSLLLIAILTCHFIFLEIMEVKKQLELLQLENQGIARDLG
jgi:hypothetical protein